MELVASTSAGTVQGLEAEGAAVFLGVPYAAPPFGPNRLAAPAPALRWDGVRPATDYGPTAPQPNRQFTLIPEPVVPGDDCLNLNVFTPSLGAAGLPVLVWIHGGGFTAGCNRSPWYRGTRFARDGVVVVSINYRLGAEGFLVLDDAPVNRGVLDWVAALEWVADNIAAFGGDPGKVTVAGQSAGGVACATLMAVPRARGLFRRAILMSGAGQFTRTYTQGKDVANTFAAELGIDSTRDAFATVEPVRIVEVQERVGRRLGPIIDGDVVAAAPLHAVTTGVTDDVDVMVGATAEEFNAMVLREGAVDDARVDRRLDRMGLSPEQIAAYRATFAPRTEPWWMLGQAVTDSTFRVPAARFAEARASSATATWAYEFRWRSPALGGMGAVHCLDVPFAFDVLDAEGASAVTGDGAPQDLADEIHGAWVSFVADGDAGWPRYDADTRLVMAFDATSKVVDDPWESLRTIWPAS